MQIMLKIGIANDHILFRKSLILLLSTIKELHVIIEADNGKKLIDKIVENPIDILILDIQMPEMNGYETCKLLSKKYPEIKILIISHFDTPECIMKAIESGAHGFFSKSTDPEKLQKAIQSIADQGFYFGTELEPALRKKLIWNQTHPNNKKYKSVNFTPQELKVIKMACQEMSSGEIAAKLNINIRTVETYRENIMTKTGARNFTGAILFALKHYYVTFS
jgi:DNA-binding NarL/FixJ family response regulator